jgi:MFS family permease
MPRYDPTVACLNTGHVLVHLAMLIFPTAVLALEPAWHIPYGQLLSLSLGGLVAYGAGSLPAGWLGDRWSRHRMMTIFFFGLGLALIATGLVQGPVGMAIGLTLIGLFASIYHPVGIAMLVENRGKVGRALGVNGVFGNAGIAGAALITGALAQAIGWRAAFVLPGALSILAGIAFLLWVRPTPARAVERPRAAPVPARALMWRIGFVLLLSTVCDSIVFNATTIAMPKVFAEHLAGWTHSTLEVGALLSFVYLVAAMAQLLVGHLIDRVSLRGIFVPIAALQVPFLIAASRAEGQIIIPVALALMFLMFGLIPIGDAMVARHVEESWRSRVYAVSYVTSFGAGPLAIPLIAAFHVESGGFSGLFLALAAISIGTVTAALVFPRAVAATD